MRNLLISIARWLRLTPADSRTHCRWTYTRDYDDDQRFRWVRSDCNWWFSEEDSPTDGLCPICELPVILKVKAVDE